MSRGLLIAFALGLISCGPQVTVPHAASAELQACAKVSGEVGSIAAVVERLNALPGQPDGACFAASVPRPLALVATTGITSAQPANSRASPRIFLMLPALVAGVVPDGDGAKLLELGEWVTATRTLKGELELPVVAKVAPGDPFKHVLFSRPDTTCALCHRDETPHDSIPGAFVSVAYKPQPGSFVSVESMAAAHEACVESGEESSRCTMWHALFDFGVVTQGAFGVGVETFVP